MIDDPMFPLTLSLRNCPGGYALLLGSGISQAAGIPTGWEIVLDLITKIAALRKEDCSSKPEEWYQAAFGAEPRYDDLLAKLAYTQEERMLLLREYFEPTEAERAEGRKLPTPAHLAIAQLVAQGNIRVIITTNFDRLMEQALEEVGITPQVVYTTEMIQGMLPLVHAKCTLIKLHGDYLDTRLKNTPEELATYDKPVNALLDQIFDEYGLIVCGWSATWDVALRNALLRCPTRRFTLYWATRGQGGPAAQDLVRHRQAVSVGITSADDFFSRLEEKMRALADLQRVHPLTVATAAEVIKRYLSVSSNPIRLDEIIQEETERLYTEFSSSRFPIQDADLNGEKLLQRLRAYEAGCEKLLAMFVVGGAWAKADQTSPWVHSLNRLANFSMFLGGNAWLINLRRYPALLLLYAAGLAGIARNNYSVLAALLLQVMIREEDSSPVGVALDTLHLLSIDAGRGLPGRKGQWTPLSEHIQEALRPALRSLLPDDQSYVDTFDKLEFLKALVHMDLSKQYPKSENPPYGCYTWRHGPKMWEELGREVGRDKESWGPLQAGLFGGSLERYMQASEALRKKQEPFIAQMLHFR